jgi:peptide deformylase
VSILDIHVLGSSLLRAETALIANFDADLQRLIDDMFETMYAAEGIGLAAPQIGHAARLAIVDVEKNPIVLINPEIVSEEGNDRAEEGCLSIPDIYGDVDRATTIRVRALDRTGGPFETEVSGLLARAIQHEIDHLHGKLFIDYLSFLKRRNALAKWEGMKEKYPLLLRRITVSDKPRASRSRSNGGSVGMGAEKGEEVL